MNEYVVETADDVYAKLHEDKVKEGDYITVMGPGQEDYQKFRVIIDKEGNKTTEIVAGFEDLMNPEEDEDDEGFEINEMDTSEDEDDKSMGGRKSRKRGRKSRKGGRKSRKGGRKSRKGGRKSRKGGRKSRKSGRKSRKSGRK